MPTSCYVPDHLTASHHAGTNSSAHHDSSATVIHTKSTQPHPCCIFVRRTIAQPPAPATCTLFISYNAHTARKPSPLAMRPCRSETSRTPRWVPLQGHVLCVGCSVKAESCCYLIHDTDRLVAMYACMASQLGAHMEYNQNYECRQQGTYVHAWHRKRGRLISH